MSKQTTRNIVKRIFWFSLVVLLAGIAYGFFYINSLLPIITGYPAKYLSSAVFVSGRSQVDVEALDLHFSFIKYTKNTVDFNDSSVTSTFLWGKSKAIYRKGFGCTLVRGLDEAALRKIASPVLASANYDQDTLAWPLGNVVKDTIVGIDREKLALVSQKLMKDNGYNGHAFALMVVHRGVPVVESYQPGFNSKTRFQSWSMAKSFTNALAGMMVKDGNWDLNQPVSIPEWQYDERSKITLHNLMQMKSGLRWNEDYGNRSDVTLMLYNESDFARFAYEQPLQDPVNSKWYYSSGTVNIINALMLTKLNNDQEYYNYIQTRLFNKIGMPRAVFEVDASGTQVGSSYIYATARDYARFGQLYLQDGIFNGERLFPEGWVDYTTSPASGSNGSYGALFWLNAGKFYPKLPDDLYSCNGHDGQRIFVVPSKELVVVVLGYSPKTRNAMDFETLMKDIIDSIHMVKEKRIGGGSTKW